MEIVYVPFRPAAPGAGTATHFDGVTAEGTFRLCPVGRNIPRNVPPGLRLKRGAFRGIVPGLLLLEFGNPLAFFVAVFSGFVKLRQRIAAGETGSGRHRGGFHNCCLLDHC